MFKKLINVKILLVLIIIVILFFIFTIINHNKLNNSNLSTDELIYYFEKNLYTFEYSEFRNTYENSLIEFELETLTNNNYIITKSVDSNINSIMFQNKLLNNDYYFIEISNDDNNPKEQTAKSQKYAYNEFLKEHQITEKQLIELLNYCFSNKYTSKK